MVCSDAVGCQEERQTRDCPDCRPLLPAPTAALLDTHSHFAERPKGSQRAKEGEGRPLLPPPSLKYLNPHGL